MADTDDASSDGSVGSTSGEKDPQILSASYLQEATSKKVLMERLRQVVHVLRSDEQIEPDSKDYPGLESLCQELIKYGDHRDKQIRLYTVCACMELFTIYAPEAPWSPEDTLDIFRQTIRQLANLSHTLQSTSPHFADYSRILDLLAEVKIAVILVEMTKEEHSTKDEALAVLADLFRTLLQSIRLEHPPEISEMTQRTICGCLEEFNYGITLPVALLDEILLCIGQGPRVLVINPRKAAQAASSSSRKTKHQVQSLQAHQVEQTNPSYVVASSIIRSSVDRLSTPIAALLNGLLNNDARLTSESSISTTLVKEIAKPQTQDQNSNADVYNTIYELHRVAPTILTTVVGTLANFLSVSHVDQRKLVIHLLGKLFIKSPTNFAVRFRPCFRQWLERAQDKDASIRLSMVQHLLQIVTTTTTIAMDDNPTNMEEISLEAQSMLKITLEDPDPQVRLKSIHGLCDTAYNFPTALALDTWLAVGQRVTSKHKQERKDTLTGLAQTYYHNYMEKRLEDIQSGGDDAPLEHVQKTLMEPEDDDRFSWIPSRVFESASWTEDKDLQARVWQAMDEMLLGSELPHSTKKLSSTSRAVGLALLVDSLEENASSWLKGLLRQRAKVQEKVAEYLEARAKIKAHRSGSVEALMAHATAQDTLEQVAKFTDLDLIPGERHPILEKFHAAKDGHIFKILSTVVSPIHSNSARVRALDELPKRVKNQGEGTVVFVKGLLRKCVMGDLLNLDITHHCILLAQEFALQEDWEPCRKLLKCIELAVEFFPAICGTAACFQNLTELFCMCRSGKRDGNDDIVTVLSTILSKAAPATTAAGKDAMDSNLQKELLRLCRRGTPEQASHAVKTLVALIQTPLQSKKTTTPDSERSAAFSSLLNSLASASVMSLSTSDEHLISSLAALAQFAESAPQAMASTRGQNMVRVALDSILQARDTQALATAELSDDDAKELSMEVAETPPRHRKSTPTRRSIVGRKSLGQPEPASLLEDTTLSATCRKLCAAIEFLVSYTRSTGFANDGIAPVSDKRNSGLPLESVEQLFDILCGILRTGGFPPSSSSRKDCNSPHDRAALRQCAAISLMRLCDARLSLDQKFLTPERWHILSSAFLDSERNVRDRVMEELGLMLTGNGKYSKAAGAGRQGMIPSFKFVAMLVLCTDGEHGADHTAANGNAANVGKRSTTTKLNANACVSSLRKLYEVASAQARANGPDAEQQFERQMKVKLMPEYVVPYAYHILAFRKETPSVTESRNNGEYDESYQRVLKRRLRWLFDPLVQTLGDTADNISFLMRLSDSLGKFEPVDHSSKQGDNGQAASKLQNITGVARQVLLTYVKKDVNLATFPGKVQIPGHLFRKAKGTKRDRSDAQVPGPVQGHSPEDAMGQGSDSSSDSLHAPSSPLKTPTHDTRSPASSVKKRRLQKVNSPARKSSLGSVHFSPEVSVAAGFSALSPIAREQSPMEKSPGVLLSSGEKTRGTTPPSALRATRFSLSTTMTGATVSESPLSKSSRIGSKLQPRRGRKFGTQDSTTSESGKTNGESPISKSSSQRSLRTTRSGRPIDSQSSTRSESVETGGSTTVQKSALRNGVDKKGKDKIGRNGRTSLPNQIKIVRRTLQDAPPAKRTRSNSQNRDNGTNSHESKKSTRTTRSMDSRGKENEGISTRRVSRRRV